MLPLGTDKKTVRFSPQPEVSPEHGCPAASPPRECTKGSYTHTPLSSPKGLWPFLDTSALGSTEPALLTLQHLLC